MFSRSVISDSLWPHELQHTRFLCPFLAPGVCSNSCTLSRWCHDFEREREREREREKEIYTHTHTHIYRYILLFYGISFTSILFRFLQLFIKWNSCLQFSFLKNIVLTLFGIKFILAPWNKLGNFFIYIFLKQFVRGKDCLFLKSLVKFIVK